VKTVENVSPGSTSLLQKVSFQHLLCKNSSFLSWHSNNNNNHDNVYGAVIMTKVIARVHPVHLMNAD